MMSSQGLKLRRIKRKGLRVMSRIKERINLREVQNNENDNKIFYRALFRAGAIVVAGYLFGTFIAWLISR